MYGYSTFNSSYQNSRLEEIRPDDRQQPQDTVSSLMWDVYQNRPRFYLSSWDGTIRYYTVQEGVNNSIIIKQGWSQFYEQPVLCCDITPEKVMIAGLATGEVCATKMETNQGCRVGMHDSPLCGVFWVQQHKVIMTLGLDNLVRFWTLQNADKCQLQVKLPLKTHACSFEWPYLMICSSESTVCIVNIQNINNANFPRYSDDYQGVSLHRFSKILCCRIVNREISKCVVGSVDGRISCSDFKQNYGKITISNSVVSKVQKMSNGRDLYGQVNCVDIGIEGRQGFVISGGTQVLELYNMISKNRGNTITTSSSSIGSATAARISLNKQLVVYATGNDWSRGLSEDENWKKPRIGLTRLGESIRRGLVTR